MNSQSTMWGLRNYLGKLRGIRALFAVLIVLLVSGCDSSGDSGGGVAPPPPPPLPPVGIGPAGGTVTGSNGATIVVPAGALTQTIDLKVTEISAASASLPAGVERVGAVYALTPHGTTFAMPVMVTVPFDTAQVPAGRTVQLSKTTDVARTVWDPVVGATVNGNMISGQVSAFSNMLEALVPTPPTITTQPADPPPVDVGQNATFTVVAEQNGGAFLTYQWRRDGIDISGANSETYTLANVSPTDNGAEFTVIIGNGVGTVTSLPATLAVNVPGPGWGSIGNVVYSATSLAPGGIAVHPDGVRVAVSYVDSSAGGLNNLLYVSEWDGSQWAQLGGVLNASVQGNNTVTAGPMSVVYKDGQPMVAWLHRQTLDLVVQQWTGNAWQRLGGSPSFPAGAVTTDPQLQLDPISGLPIVTLTSGNFTSVRSWNGSGWEPANFLPSATLVAAFTHIVLGTGQRLLAKVVGVVDENGDPIGLQSRLFGPHPNDFLYTVDFGPDISPQMGQGVLIATEGLFPYALTGDFASGPVVVRRLSGAWQTITGDSGINSSNGIQAFSVNFAFLVTPAGLPVLGYITGTNGSRKVEGKWWDGASWQSVPAASSAAVDAFRFAATLNPIGLPYVLIAQRNPAVGSPATNEIIVRRYAAVVITVNVNGPAGSGTVSAGGQTCAVGNSCEVPLPTGATLELIATPASGFSLQSWTDCASVVGDSCTVNADQSKTVTATFQ